MKDRAASPSGRSSSNNTRQSTAMSADVVTARMDGGGSSGRCNTPTMSRRRGGRRLGGAGTRTMDHGKKMR